MHPLAARRQQCGQGGESAAADHLTTLGYTVLERNFRIGHLEADLIALSPRGAVAVVEVKARNGPWHGEARVDQTKRSRLLRLAAMLATEQRFAGRIFQFDVVAVEVTGRGTIVTHFPHAFDASGTAW